MTAIRSASGTILDPKTGELNLPLEVDAEAVLVNDSPELLRLAELTISLGDDPLTTASAVVLQPGDRLTARKKLPLQQATVT